MDRAFNEYIPRGVSELLDHLALMILSSPTFRDDYFTDQNLDSVFWAYVEGLTHAKDTLGAERFQLLLDLTAKARALFENDPQDENGASDQGRHILLDMNDILRNV